MTLPNEEYNSLMSAKQFLYDLLNETVYPDVSPQVRERARRILKHYPMNHSIDERYKDVSKGKSILTEYKYENGWGKGKDE